MIEPYPLSRNSILDVAVDSAELLRDLLSLVNDVVKGDIRRVAARSISLVATLCDNVAVVVGATAVPGKELK